MSGKRYWLAFLVAVAILGSGLRLYRLASRSLWYDEVGILRVSGYVDSSLSFLRPEFTNDPPLFPLVAHFWYALVRAIPGVTQGSVACDYLLRLLPCVLGIASILLTFSACRYVLKDNETALITAFLVAISPFQIYYAQQFRAYTLYVALSLVALVCMSRALEEDRLRYWIGLTASLVLSVYGNFFSVWNIAAMDLYFLMTLKRHRKLVAKWVACQGIVVLLIIPALILSFRLNQLLEQAEEHWFPPPDIRTAFITFKNFFAGYSANHDAYRALFLLCAALLVLGLYGLRKKRSALLLTCVLAFFPILCNVIIWHVRSYSYYTHRLMIFSAVPCYILVAEGMRTLRKRVLTTTAIAVLVALTIPCLADHYAQRIHPDWGHRLGARYKVQNREAAHYIAEHMASGDFVGHTSHFTLCPFTYYLSADQRTLGFAEEERQGLLRSYPNEPMWERLGFFPVRIEPAIERARRIWLVQSWWEPFDLDPLSRQLRAWLDGHCIREERKPFDGLTVYLYTNNPALRMETETYQLADYGDDVVVSYYRFPDDEEGRVEQNDWQRRFLAEFPASADVLVGNATMTDATPALYGVEYDVVVARNNQIAVEGRAYDISFITGDDGEALRVEDTGAVLGEGDTIRLGSADYSLLALDPQKRQAVLASFPLSASNEFTYRFIVRNASGTARTVECTVYESAYVIEPLSFSRCNPNSDVWRPTLQYNLNPPPERFNGFAMVARLSTNFPEGEALYRDVRLDAGRYTMLARILEESLERNQARATCTFTVVPRGENDDQSVSQLIGTVKGNNPSGTTGWTWREVGEIVSDGEPFRLVVSAYNDDHLEKAYFDIDRVMFVPREEEEVRSSPIEPERFEITLSPREEKQYTLTGDLGASRMKQIDIELFDTESKESRRVWFHVGREE